MRKMEIRTIIQPMGIWLRVGLKLKTIGTFLMKAQGLCKSDGSNIKDISIT